MKKYTTPEVEVVIFQSETVIADSTNMGITGNMDITVSFGQTTYTGPWPDPNAGN